MTLRTPTCLPLSLARKGVYSSSYHFCVSSRTREAQPKVQHRRYANSAQAKSSLQKKLRSPIATPESRQIATSQPHQVTSTQLQSSSQQLASTQSKDSINPPISTLPAPVNPPERQPDQSKIKWLYYVGKAYVAFYKTGVKNVWANRKLQKALCEKVREMSQKEEWKGHMEQLSEHSWKFSMTRAEWWTIERSRYDWRRVPIFALILLIFGEWTPLIVVFATPLVPYTCRIPSQIEKARRKQEDRRRSSFRGELQEPITVIGQQRDESAELRGRLQHVCRSLGLYPRFWDNQSTRDIWPTTNRMHQLVKDRIALATMDDQMLCTAVSTKKTGETLADKEKAAERAAEQLSLEELKLACEYRGIDVLGQPEKVLRESLTLWLKISTRQQPRSKSGEEADRTIEDHPVYRLCLVRPRSWQS